MDACCLCIMKAWCLHYGRLLCLHYVSLVLAFLPVCCFTIGFLPDIGIYYACLAFCVQVVCLRQPLLPQRCVCLVAGSMSACCLHRICLVYCLCRSTCFQHIVLVSAANPITGTLTPVNMFYIVFSLYVLWIVP